MFTSSSIFHAQLLLSFCLGVCHQGCQSKSSYCPMSAKQHAPIHLLHHQKELGRTNRSLPSVLLSWVGRDNPSKTFGILSGIDCLWKQPPCISLQTYCSGWPLTITNRCTGVWPSTISKIWLYCGRSSGHWKMLALFVDVCGGFFALLVPLNMVMFNFSWSLGCIKCWKEGHGTQQSVVDKRFSSSIQCTWI